MQSHVQLLLLGRFNGFVVTSPGLIPEVLTWISSAGAPLGLGIDCLLDTKGIVNHQTALKDNCTQA